MMFRSHLQRNCCHLLYCFCYGYFLPEGSHQSSPEYHVRERTESAFHMQNSVPDSVLPFRSTHPQILSDHRASVPEGFDLQNNLALRLSGKLPSHTIDAGQFSRLSCAAPYEGVNSMPDGNPKDIGKYDFRYAFARVALAKSPYTVLPLFRRESPGM